MTQIEDRRHLIPFRAILLPQVFTDVLVIGSGVAGLRAALSAAEGAEVICLAKGEATRSNTAWAQGGIAAVLTDEDSVADHVEDTLSAGAGLCSLEAVEGVISEGPKQVRRLLDLGMGFDRNEAGELLFGREGAHSAHRILHADGDATGRVLAETLIRAAREHERIRLFENCFALDLVTAPGGEGRCLGAITHHPKHGLQVIWARSTVLASGGAGQVYRETSNAPGATGDGIAMAWRAGAELADMEFVQFHPTTLYVAGAARALISEAVRGEGAHLVDGGGRRFMVGVHELAELAPRDIVSRAIHAQLSAGSNARVFLDARTIGTERFRQRFPSIFELLAEFGIDPGHDLVPIRPAAHYTIGGVVADLSGRTSLPGLLACGEVACTGLHGANRLASNSLLEGLVCGDAAGREALESLGQSMSAPTKIVSDIRPSTRSALDVDDVLSSLRSVLWRHVGIERDGGELADVEDMLEFWGRYTLDKIFDETKGWEVQNALTIAALVTASARAREESRGTHFRRDFPESVEASRVRRVVRRGAEPRLEQV